MLGMITWIDYLVNWYCLKYPGIQKYMIVDLWKRDFSPRVVCSCYLIGLLPDLTLLQVNFPAI